MNRRTIAAVAVALLMVSSGCLGVFDSGESGSEGVETETEGTPDGESTSDGEEAAQLPAGIESSGEVNESIVVGNHRATLQETTSTLTFEETTTIGDREFVRTVAVNVGESGAVEAVKAADGREIEHWLGDDSYRRVTNGDVTRYSTVEQDGSADLLRQYRYFAHFSAADFEYTGTETVDGKQVAVIKADGISESQSLAQLYGGNSVTDYTATAHVTENGVITSLEVSMTVERSSGADVSVDNQYSVTDVGSTTVERPDWVADAEEEAVQMEVEQASGEYAALRMTAGEEIPSGSTAVVVTPDTTYEVELDQSVAPGDTIYFAVGSDGTAVASVNEQPSAGGQIDAAFVQIATDNSVTVYEADLTDD